MRPVRRAAIAAALLCWAVVVVAGPVAAQDDGFGWIINRFDIDVTVEADGAMHVVEDIVVDFRSLERHGIFRVIPVRYDLSPGDVQIDLPAGRPAGEFVRAIEIDNIHVTSSAPSDLVVEEPTRFEGRELSLRIGDEDRTVSGRQTYRISYDVRGALNAFEGHGELYWNATGNDWEVPIRRSRVTVHASRISEVACFRGPVGATFVCDESSFGKRTATFSASNLQPGEGLTFVAAFPSAAVAVAPPILVEKWNPVRAFNGSRAALPGAVLVALLGLVGVGLLAFRQGRDRVTRGGVAVDGMVDAGPAERRGLFAPRVTPVEFRPPDSLRPAQVGVLIDERVDPVDISATIVDLAVRGHLRITEIEERKLWFGKTDWELERLASDDPLQPFEQRLLNGLFEDGSPVRVKALKGTFVEHYKATQSLLYTDAHDQGWFPRRPDHVRTMWLVLGVLVMALGVGAFVLAMMFTTWAVAVLPLVPIGVVLAVAHRWMPHRTPHGSRTLNRVLGFRQFIVTAEAGRAEYAEHQNLFVTYLPFAVVFGAVDKWAQTFASLGAAAATTGGVGGWYIGAHPGGFDARGFSRGLTDFSSAVGSSLPVAPASSGSSGFSGGSSGGGFGGGGGGSW
ncbi:MAG: DUF2207 domain-containing protein [Nitriliruptorales bacterium]|nr:DUF2207 domain-containing protein [Nitriliruptorales bacterium]